MKHLPKTIVLFLMLTLILTACEKKEINEMNPDLKRTDLDSEKIQQKEKVLRFYYIDNKPADKNEYIRYKEQIKEPFIVHSLNQDSETHETIEVITCFSTKEDYINFGDKNGLNLKGQLKFETLMREYVEAHDVEQKLKATGVIPMGYFDYESECHNKIFGENTKANSKANSISFYNDRNGSGVPLNVFHTLAVVGCPYNNNIESFKVNGLVTYNFAVYDRYFYRSRLATYTGRVYWEHLEEMSSGVKNKTSSINKWW